MDRSLRLRLRDALDDLRDAATGRRVGRALDAVAGLAFALLLVGMAMRGTVVDGGQGGIDAYAYWHAGESLRAGAPLYGGASGDFGSFLYPPVFAQLMAPLSLLPFAAFLWLWRCLELAALRYVMGSWRTAGLAILVFWPIFVELDIANVNLLLAAATAAAIRGDARALAGSVLTKFATLAALGPALRFDRRGLIVGVGVVLGACVLSLALSPALWTDYARFLSTAQAPAVNPDDWHNVGALLPTALRFGLAAAMALAAWRWARLAAVAVTLAMPVLWFHGLSVLIAAWARPGERSEERERTGPRSDP